MTEVAEVSTAHTFSHLDIFHMKPEDFLLLKEEKDFWVLHLKHAEGILFDASINFEIETREWLTNKGYSPHFVYELLPLCTEEWVMFTPEGDSLENMERFNW